MISITLSPSVLQLSRTPAEKLLLAYVCQRAAANPNGVCTDGNKELAQAVNMHLQTVSDLLTRLKEAGLLGVIFVGNRTSQRLLAPPKLIAYASEDLTKPIAYVNEVDGQMPKPITYVEPVAPKSTAHSTPVPVREIRFCPVPGVDITHQRASCRLVTITTLRRMARFDRPQFAALVDRFLLVRVNDSTSSKCMLLSLAVRQLEKRD